MRGSRFGVGVLMVAWLAVAVAGCRDDQDWTGGRGDGGGGGDDAAAGRSDSVGADAATGPDVWTAPDAPGGTYGPAPPPDVPETPPDSGGGGPDVPLPPLLGAQFVAVEWADQVAVDDGAGVALVTRYTSGTQTHRAALVDLAARTVTRDLYPAQYGVYGPPLIDPGLHLGRLAFSEGGATSPDGYPLNQHIVDLADGSETLLLAGWTQAAGIDPVGHRLFTGVESDGDFHVRIYSLPGGALLHAGETPIPWEFDETLTAPLVDADAGIAYVYAQEGGCAYDPSRQGILAVDFESGAVTTRPLSLPGCADPWLARTPDGSRLILTHTAETERFVVQVDATTGETLRSVQPDGFSAIAVRLAVPERDRLYLWLTGTRGPRGGSTLRTFRLSDLEPVAEYEVDTSNEGFVPTDGFYAMQHAPMAPHGADGLVLIVRDRGVFFVDGVD